MKARSRRGIKVGAIFRIKPSHDSIYDLCTLLAGYIDEELCLKNPVERAKALKNYLSDLGIEASYLRADPNIFVANRELPRELRGILEEVKPSFIEDVLGFMPDAITYEFYKGEESYTPYAILYKRPYKCEKDALVVSVYFEDVKFLDAFRELLHRSDYGARRDRRIVWQFYELRSLEELVRKKDDDVKVVLIRPRERESREFIELARIKVVSYRSDKSHLGPSYLQLVDGEKLIRTLESWERYGPEKVKDYAKSFLATLLSSIYYKGDCTPFRVKLPDEELNAIFKKSLIVGVSISRASDAIYKGVAVVMTGYGEVITLISKDFRVLKGESYEFDEEEIKKFREEIKRHVDAYKEKFGAPPELVIIVRSRIFLGREVEMLLGSEGDKDEVEKKLVDKLTSRFWWRRHFKKVLVMSVYKTKYSFGEDVAVLASRRDDKRGSSGVWFVQLKKQKYAAQIVWHYTEKDAKLPLAAYLYIRALDFTSLHKSRVIPFPIRIARRFLRWLIARGIAVQTT